MVNVLCGSVVGFFCSLPVVSLQLRQKQLRVNDHVQIEQHKNDRGRLLVSVSLLLRILQPRAGVKLKEDNVPVLDGIVPALLPILARGLGARFAALLLKIVEMHHLSHDETLLKVGVNPAGRLRGLRSALDGPRLHLVRPRREEVLQLQCLVARRDDFVQHRGALGFLFVRLPVGRIFLFSQRVLKQAGERNQRGSRVVLVDPLLDLGQPLVLLADKVLLRQVRQIDVRLGRQEEVLVQHFDVVGGPVGEADVLLLVHQHLLDLHQRFLRTRRENVVSINKLFANHNTRWPAAKLWEILETVNIFYKSTKDHNNLRIDWSETSSGHLKPCVNFYVQR